MKEMKYFLPCESISVKQMLVCMISNIFELLLTFFFVLLVYFPFMQSTQVLKLVKSRVSSTPSVTSLLILSREICPSLLCHNFNDFSFMIQRLIPMFSCVAIKLYGIVLDKLILNKLSFNTPFPIIVDSNNKSNPDALNFIE